MLKLGAELYIYRKFSAASSGTQIALSEGRCGRTAPDLSVQTSLPPAVACTWPSWNWISSSTPASTEAAL